MNRRKLLAAAAALIPAGILAACSGATAPTVSQVATDVNLIASGLAPSGAVIATIPNVSAAVVKQVQADLALIQADAAKIATATANPPAGTVQEIVPAVQALAGIAALIPALAPYQIVIQAAVALLPVILASAGVNVVGAAPVMPAATARSILKLSAHQ